jgi:hypothetical protein
VVIVLVLGSRFASSNLAKDNGFLRVIKLHSTTSLRGKVKPLVPCREMFRHVKNPAEYERDIL